MVSVNIASTLMVDDEMHQAVLDGLGEHAPDQVAGLTWERFTTPKSWTLIPNEPHAQDPWHKAEFIVKQGPPYLQTIKVNVWNSGDLRLNGKAIPHTHPWEEFIAKLVMGGYTECRYVVENPRLIIDDPYSCHELGDVHASEFTYQAGTEHNRNYMPRTVFHEVTRVLKPRRTVSVMVCGPGRKEAWGYLDPGTGRYTPHKLSTVGHDFQARKLALNVHHRT